MTSPHEVGEALRRHPWLTLGAVVCILLIVGGGSEWRGRLLSLAWLTFAVIWTVCAWRAMRAHEKLGDATEQIARGRVATNDATASKDGTPPTATP
jgi:hypothetical protein